MRKFFLVVLILPIGANADVIYTYTGNNFTTFDNDNQTFYAGVYDSTMSVMGSFVFSSLIPANSTDFDAGGLIVDWTLFDGRNTLTSTNSRLIDIEFSTDSAGNVTGWDIKSQTIFASTPSIGDFFFNIWTNSSRDFGSIFEITIVDADGFGGRLADRAFASTPGTWVSPSASVPEPGTLALLGIGLVALGVSRRKRIA